jgi:hypothetical protein
MCRLPSPGVEKYIFYRRKFKKGENFFDLRSDPWKSAPLFLEKDPRIHIKMKWTPNAPNTARAKEKK